MESVILDKVEEACWEFVEEGASVVFDEVTVWLSCKCEHKIRGETNAPSTCHEGEQGFDLRRVLAE